MPKRCKECNLSFEPEPGYYFGAMFISYIISGFGLLGIALLAVFYFQWKVVAAMSLVVLMGTLFYIKVLRISRSLWIHANVRYQPNILKKQKQVVKQ